MVSTSSSEEVLRIDVSAHNTVYAVVISTVNINVPVASSVSSSYGAIPSIKANSIDDLLVTRTDIATTLRPKGGNEKNSSTWNNYKSTTPSENNNDDYEDNTYWPMAGNRYGLEHSHAQVNGSLYIADR